MSKAVFILLALLAVQASATLVTTCGIGQTDFTSVTISDCPGDQCILKKGSTISVSIKFYAPYTDTSDFTIFAYLIVGGTRISLEGINDKSICDKVYKVSDDMPAQCPLGDGEQYVYKDSFEVLDSYPLGGATMNLNIIYKDKSVCFNVLVQISA